MSIISDLATLVNAGIKPADILSIMKAEKDSKKDPEQNPNDINDKKDPEQNPNAAADKKDPETDPDYKSLYEQTKKDLEELQAKNTKKKIDIDEPSFDEIIKNIKAEVCR